MGSTVGTAKDEIDRLKKEGINVGIISLKSFRPFPYEAMRKAIGDTKHVVCVERAFSFGARGIVALKYSALWKVQTAMLRLLFAA